MWRARCWAAGRARRPPPSQSMQQPRKAMLALMISPSGLSILPNECVGIGEPAAAQDAVRAAQQCATAPRRNCDQREPMPCMAPDLACWRRQAGGLVLEVSDIGPAVGGKLRQQWAFQCAFLALQLANRKCITSPSLTA